jgi:SAM-dependent methyltransferase
MLRAVHERFVHARRVRVLRNHLLSLLPSEGSVLDLGCGDGLLSYLIAERRPDLVFTGLDVVARSSTHIPVRHFDGKRIPLPNAGVDMVMLIDVLHHADDPVALLAEAVRVTRSKVLIKDHCLDGSFAGPTLRLMDWVGNAHHGVPLPYNYLRRDQWDSAFAALDLTVECWRDQLGLYAPPASWIFERKLHFIASLKHRQHQNA